LSRDASMPADDAVFDDRDARLAPRERILAAAEDLFYRQGIRAVGVEAIAEAARTNKMTLYRHFASKDELVAEYLRRCAAGADAAWARQLATHPADPLAQLLAWLDAMSAHVERNDQRGCPLANAAVELPDRNHPARRVIEDYKIAQRKRLIALCEAARLEEPDLLADELELLLEGARVTAQTMGPASLGDRLRRMGRAMIAMHRKQ
jgi:AcrR family transcriptional regulator